MSAKAEIIVTGVNGNVMTIAGDNSGDQGIWLGTDIQGGFFDPPVQVTYEQPGQFPGARFLYHRIQKRDFEFTVVILNDDWDGDPWSSRDSEWRKMWAYDKDTLITVNTDQSGSRTLKCRLIEAPEVTLRTDPNIEPLAEVHMKVTAPDPFWYEEDIVIEGKTKKNTQFNPDSFAAQLQKDSTGEQILRFFDINLLPTEDITLTVNRENGRGGVNPTDQYIWPRWTLPGSDKPIPQFPLPFPPGIPIPWETAPFIQWVVPDYDFENDEQTGDGNRRVKLPGLIIGEDSVVDTDPRVETIMSDSGSQVWARMNGVRFRYPIPPYTFQKEFKVTVTGAKAGTSFTLRLPRPWTRPWGLES